MANPLNRLFGSDVRSPFERVLLAVCGTSALVFIALWQLGPYHLPSGITNIVTVVFIASMLLFAGSFIALGVLVVGRSAGKKTYGAQARYTFGRTFLYLLLPCLVFAIASVVWAVLTGRV
ncbi:MAG TPA: hypothetical protein VL737_01265 [Candidatus Pristimantibacillus sp.]|nr:hypothetical protein [Candidatus Pristimantibacillus sp.]